VRGSRGDSRSSALWGTGNRGGDSRVDGRSNALWGKGTRGLALMLGLLVVLALPVTGAAAPNGKNKPAPPKVVAPKVNPPKVDPPKVAEPTVARKAFVPPSLLAKATANPDQTFTVIVQGSRGTKSDKLGDRVSSDNGRVKRTFRLFSGASVDISGKKLLKLAERDEVLSITPDVKVETTGYNDSEMWRQSTRVDMLWESLDPMTGMSVGPAPQAPAIAIVDSGVEASKEDFGDRLVASVNLSSLSPADASGDDEGHGTMVAAVAAGASARHPGVAQNAPLVSIRTADAKGQSRTSDVIAAADWILENKDKYGIRVANFSLAGATETSFRFDPLDRAVERLWFAGVVVVAAAGNHGTGAATSMSYAPANDPFIITVGAVDQAGTSEPWDDTVPSWSAYGYTMDGFSKPDMVAPGRYMVSAVPMDSDLATTAPDRVMAPGYMWMSGTSFAAPVVAGAAAQILARHPDWGPNEVKGALMLTSNYLWSTPEMSAGVGEIDAFTAASLDFTPPNPNENFMPFVVTDPVTGGKTFDQASWSSYVAGAASWSSASWSSASWSSASWSSASWSSASWSSASWSSTMESMMQSTATFSESTSYE
jgi:serine protease AprX